MDKTLQIGAILTVGLLPLIAAAGLSRSTPVVAACPTPFRSCIQYAIMMQDMLAAPDPDLAADLQATGHVDTKNFIANTCRTHGAVKACGVVFTKQCQREMDRNPKIRVQAGIFSQEFEKTDALCATV